ncbi:hypothetical protein KsCSTR_38550 [Candidatus Kuenenia stuttgartiensis]|uniref:Uncharacterized protein n=1 Tax=Kuenenia stuttgartiensis TaxID=174633 RepID=Q1PUT5_KUEST|nr:hypothetical protein KsCSTR_38550 [Candidatus Kuenenia stuttgartiensis]CAJ70987.1 unknown protein [Candidatus Kuenenia stuttgartiensis]
MQVTSLDSTGAINPATLEGGCRCGVSGCETYLRQPIGNAFLRATHMQAKNTRGTKKNLKKR